MRRGDSEWCTDGQTDGTMTLCLGNFSSQLVMVNWCSCLCELDTVTYMHEMTGGPYPDACVCGCVCDCMCTFGGVFVR
jgi:hypothetical protein